MLQQNTTETSHPQLTLRVVKVHENARLPERGHPTDAGADVRYCPESDLSDIVMEPGESVLFGTGLKIEVPYGYMLEVKNKSGIAAKSGLLVGACVIDRGYDGEIFVNLHNTFTTPQTVKAFQKIAQLVLVKIAVDPTFVGSDKIYDNETSRGAGALGSTGL